jgi:hypothetical protein
MQLLIGERSSYRYINNRVNFKIAISSASQFTCTSHIACGYPPQWSFQWFLPLISELFSSCHNADVPEVHSQWTSKSLLVIFQYLIPAILKSNHSLDEFDFDFTCVFFYVIFLSVLQLQELKLDIWLAAKFNSLYHILKLSAFYFILSLQSCLL